MFSKILDYRKSTEEKWRHKRQFLYLSLHVKHIWHSHLIYGLGWFHLHLTEENLITFWGTKVFVPISSFPTTNCVYTHVNINININKILKTYYQTAQMSENLRKPINVTQLRSISINQKEPLRPSWLTHLGAVSMLSEISVLTATSSSPLWISLLFLWISLWILL